MSKNTKNILIGIVIGAIVVAGGQYAWSKYKTDKGIKDLSVSMQGLKTATNKIAYLNTLFTEKAKSSGVSVGLSNSSASEGESAYCYELDDYMQTIFKYVFAHLGEAGYEQNVEIAMGYINLGVTYGKEANCGSGYMQ